MQHGTKAGNVGPQSVEVEPDQGYGFNLACSPSGLRPQRLSATFVDSSIRISVQRTTTVKKAYRVLRRIKGKVVNSV